MRIQKSYNFREFLLDPRVDITTGVIVSREGRFHFVLLQSGQWKKDEKGRLIMPFVGIGGRVKGGESPIEAVHREAVEEVGVDVKILGQRETIILMNLERIVKIKVKPWKEELPLIVFRMSSQQPDRKPIINVLIYAAKFTPGEIKPLDNPAIIELDTKLLMNTLKEPMSLEKFRAYGGKIISRIELPENGFLKPIGTAYAVGICLQRKIIDKKFLSENRIQEWWEQFK